MKTQYEIIDESVVDYIMGDKLGMRDIVILSMNKWHNQESEKLRSEIIRLNKLLDNKYVDKH